MENLLKNILTLRHFFVKESDYETTKEDRAYYNAYLLSSFGVVVDKPELLDASMLKEIAKVIKEKVPSSFYDNPQDMKYYRTEELLVEQLVSYFLVENLGYFDRVKIFEHDLPKYTMSKEMKLRKYSILTLEEADSKLETIAEEYASYTRPFSLLELEDFEALYKEGYYNGQELGCKDNIIRMLDYDVTFARMLDKKDLVKLSIERFGDKKKGLNNKTLDKDDLSLLREAFPLVKSCPLSKKQAKYYNKIIKLIGVDATKESNINSTYRLANVAMKEGRILDAARIFAKNGSLLERNLRYLLSRANPVEAVAIIDMLPSKNPVVLRQIEATIQEDSEFRQFTFFNNGLTKSHLETEEEGKWRKSRLNEATMDLVRAKTMENIEKFYSSLEPLGKIYVNESFFKVALPTNTSSSGIGLDVPPSGSRLPIKGKYIRTFVHWKNIYDVDASLIVEDKEGHNHIMYYGNYRSKEFGDAVLFSGDDRSDNGVEYFDIKIEELKKMGYKKATLCFNGFAGRFNECNVYAGYQDLNDLETKAWNPKNIAMQYKVEGDSSSHVSLCFDLETNEVVVLNLMRDASNRTVGGFENKIISRYTNEDFLRVNVGSVASLRGEVVDDPKLADFVFDDEYEPSESQRVIRSFDIPTLVSLTNGEDISLPKLESNL